MPEFLNFEVECPNCGTKFSVEEVLSEKVRSEFQDRIRQQVDNEIRKFKEQEFERIELEHKLEIEKLKNELETQKQIELTKAQVSIENLLKQLSNLQKELEEAREKELEFRRKEAELIQKEQNIELELQRRLNYELENFKTELEKKNKELEEARKIELEYRRKETELFQKEQTLELEIQRRLSEERKQLQEIVKQTVHSEYELKLRERDETISSLQRKIEELNVKIQMGSQQLQGEVQEILLEEQLRIKFPFDSIQPVPKGIRGADIIQVVRNKLGEECGKILWESKRTQNWSNDWIPKLKEDQREIGAEFAIIVSRVLPKEIPSIGLLDGVWVCNFDSFVGLAMALRENLLQVNTLKNTLVGRETKMEQIYNYICSEQFAQKVRAIVEAFVSMKNDLDKEKAAMEKHWKKREEELNKVLKNTAKIYGEIEALVGNQLPEIEYLKLPGS
ncbi:MAG: DUF2130 domain-containing protein [Ignavibacteria bacterium]|nr:DUF2130 domain-containing protein [Ignavibacteria bacterium]